MNNLFKKKLTVRKSIADIAAACIFIAFCLYMLLYGRTKWISRGFGSVGIVDDRLFPTIICTVALICAIGILLMGIADFVKESKDKTVAPKTTDFSIMVLFLLAVGLFFYYGMKKIGYPLCNFLCVLAVYYLHGGKKLWKGILVAGIFTLVCYLFFAVYLGVNLPKGFGL